MPGGFGAEKSIAALFGSTLAVYSIELWAARIVARFTIRIKEKVRIR